MPPKAVGTHAVTYRGRLERAHEILELMCHQRNYTLAPGVRNVQNRAQARVVAYGAAEFFVAAYADYPLAHPALVEDPKLDTVRHVVDALIDEYKVLAAGRALVLALLASKPKPSFNKDIREFCTSHADARIELWSVDELQYDVLGHVLQPKFAVVAALPPDVARTTALADLGTLKVTDPVARRLALRRGQLVRCDRVDSQCGRYQHFRVVR